MTKKKSPYYKPDSSNLESRVGGLGAGKPSYYGRIKDAVFIGTVHGKLLKRSDGKHHVDVYLKGSKVLLQHHGYSQEVEFEELEKRARSGREIYREAWKLVSRGRC
jgi:hypothetical protein